MGETSSECSAIDSIAFARRRGATRRPRRRPQALLLFIAAVLIDILGVLDQSMPALDCIYGPARNRVEINSRDASSHRRDYGVTPRGQR